MEKLSPFYESSFFFHPPCRRVPRKFIRIFDADRTYATTWQWSGTTGFGAVRFTRASGPGLDALFFLSSLRGGAEES
jgi:hypothetical protein